uniref:Putative ovule protein n=1 Tax=Solanum chacoense TaxID=4108 RepID=A0A0V0H3V8_SOLCH
MIWNEKIPYKVACFTWLVAKEAVLTQADLRSRDFSYVPELLCGEKTEISNSFLHCNDLENFN